MTIEEVEEGVVADVYVKPKSKKFQWKMKYGELVVFCKKPPVRGRVNRELINRLSKIFKRRASILSGYTSRHKKILIRGLSIEELKSLVNQS
ncbi:MAG: DUF167 family protein [Thermoproteota archaeon]